MKRLLAAALIVIAGGCATSPDPVEVAVIRSGETFYADFHFPRRARAWVFVRSSLARVGEPAVAAAELDDRDAGCPARATRPL